MEVGAPARVKRGNRTKMQPEPDITDRRSRRDDAEDAKEKRRAPGTQDLPACIVNAADCASRMERGRWSAVRLHDVAGRSRGRRARRGTSSPVSETLPSSRLQVNEPAYRLPS